MNELDSLGGLGLTLPSPLYLFGAMFFGLVGFAAYRYGKRMSLPRTKWLGVVLMLYPYAISRPVVLYSVGCVLCLALYLWRD